MTNSVLFREKVKAQKTTIKALAETIGLTRQGLTKKIDNKSEFKSGEISKICTLLNLPKKERETIFFAMQVDNMPTKGGENNVRNKN